MTMFLGSDPEALIVRPDRKAGDGRLVPASRLLKMSAKMGCDGCDSVAELRPNAAQSPREHYAHIKRLLVVLNKKFAENKRSMGRLEAVAGSGSHDLNYVIGGHIHFGSDSDVFRQTSVKSKMLPVLDALLQVPFTCVEMRNNNIYRRMYGGYGQPGSYQDKRYGFEYRTPASWLVSPLYTKAALAIAFVIGDYAESTNGGGVLLNQTKEHFAGKFSPADIKQARLDKLRPLALQESWRMLRKFPGYRLHRRDIDPLFGVILQNRFWNEEADVLKAHGLRSNIENISPFDFSQNDDGVAALGEFLSEFPEDKVKQRLKIFGLHAKRDYDLAVSRDCEWVADAFIEALPPSVAPRVFVTDSHGPSSIGIGRQYRLNYFAHVVTALRGVEARLADEMRVAAPEYKALVTSGRPPFLLPARDEGDEDDEDEDSGRYDEDDCCEHGIAFCNACIECGRS